MTTRLKLQLSSGHAIVRRDGPGAGAPHQAAVSARPNGA